MATLAQEAATLCPLSDPGDQRRLDRCRATLFKNSFFKRSLARIVLWGRPSPVPGGRLKDTTLTQFGAEVLSGLYLPLFMFNGRYRVDYDPTEARYRARLEGVFRNNLLPGQYPYPFWHDAKKWSDYQRANGITLWIDPHTSKIVVGAVLAPGRRRSAPEDGRRASRPRSTASGCGSTTRASRSPSPRCSSACSARTIRISTSCRPRYKDLALAMRNGTCDSCHVPNNPEKMKRLVLLQTPAHAAGEIKRVMAAVRDNRMPLDEIGIEKELRRRDEGGAAEVRRDVRVDA